MLGHHVDHAQRQWAGVDVEHAQPGEIRNPFDDLLQETGQTVFDAEIGAVADRVLGDEDDLPGPLGHEVDNLLQDMQRTLADLAALDAGDCAEGTGVIAAIGDFHVGGRPSLGPAEGGQHALTARDFRLRFLAQELADDVADAVPLPRREDVVDAGRNIVR